jgi:hypothetical protein
VLVGVACAVASALPGCSSSAQERTERTGTASLTGREVLRDRPFRCQGPVDLELVRVTMRTQIEDAVRIGQKCTGRIARLEVDTWTGDGIKVENAGDVAHDLVIESGYVKCHDVAGDYHQDGIHVMGGRRITFRKLRVDCRGNANFFVSKGGLGASTPTDILCDGCLLGPRSAQTLFIGESVRSGARDTTVCTGRHRATRLAPEAKASVTVGNDVLSRRDSSCADVP